MKRDDIYKNDFNFVNDFEALNTTKSLSRIEYKGLTLYFSYNTLVAYYCFTTLRNYDADGWTICKNVWSNTTAKHLYKINPNKSIRIEHADFMKKAEKDLDLKPLEDPFKTVSAISKMFSIMSDDDTEESIRKSNNQRLRFYETQGVTRPYNWDSLTIAEQKKRLDLCDYQGLNEGVKL